MKKVIYQKNVWRNEKGKVTSIGCICYGSNFCFDISIYLKSNFHRVKKFGVSFFQLLRQHCDAYNMHRVGVTIASE